MNIQEIWKAAPESFYAGTAKEINTFTGVTDATMYRDDGWHFIQLGRYIERVQLSASILLAQIAAQGRQDKSFEQGGVSNRHRYVYPYPKQKE